MDNNSGHILYDKVQTVRMPDGRNRNLRITVSETGRPFKKVVLKITDDDDPSILYSLHVTELDFTSLKAQQGLLVEFSNFAVHLVRLLEQCIGNGKGFFVVIEEGPSETCLKIVQPIDLKNLCYISLNIAPGSETEILQHMKSQIFNLKTNREADREECHILHQQVLQLKQQLQEKDYEFRRQEETFFEEREDIKKKAAAEMRLLQDQLLMEKQSDVQTFVQKEERLKTQVEELSTELRSLKDKHRKLSDKYEDSLKTMTEQSILIGKLEDTHSQIRGELTDLRRHNSEIEGLLRKRDQELDDSRAHNEMIEKELSKVRVRLSQQDQLLKSADQEQAKLRMTVNHLQGNSDARDDLLRQVNNDLTKANLIIKERQKEVEAGNNEIKRLAIDNQEKQRQLAKQALEMNLLKATLEKNEEKLHSLSIKEKELMAKVASLKKSLSTKEEEHAKCGDVISYLHRSLKKAQLESSAAPSPIFHNAAIIPPPTFASINPVGLGEGSKGPYYSTPLGSNGIATTTKRKSYPGTGADHVGDNGITRKSEEHLPKEVLKPSQVVSQKPLKRPEMTRRKDVQSKIGSSENTASSTKPKENGLTEAKDAAKRTQNKENKKSAQFKPSSYFQPNRIKTDF